MTIEYVQAQWNFFTGCLHGKDICATSATCWARDMSRRFKQVCGGDFEPRFHPERLAIPLHWKKPRRVAVSFMGDLFGAWNDGDEDVEHILRVVNDCPQHQFLFLTKRPENLAQWNPWPANAWVGTSITGAEIPQRQADMLDALHQVEGAGVRWVSLEPLLAPICQEASVISKGNWVDWAVVGAQSGRGATPPPLDYIKRLAVRASFLGRPIWIKNNALKIFPTLPHRQELPDETPKAIAGDTSKAAPKRY